jgi:hypothetical protein
MTPLTERAGCGHANHGQARGRPNYRVFHAPGEAASQNALGQYHLPLVGASCDGVR